MDPVSELLAGRERSRPRLLPWIVAAVLIHGLAVGAAFIVGRKAGARPTHLPAVSVRLVKPQAQIRRRPPGPQGAPAPRPTAAPTARPTVGAPPTAAPTAPPPATARPRTTTSAPTRPPSRDAMATAEGRRTPAPTPTPAPAGGGGGGGSGLSLGGGSSGGGAAPGIPSDFHFTYYVERMLALIESRWYKPPAPPGTRARVRFRIRKDGRLEAIELEESSGNSSFDRAVLRALYATNPLPPLPPAYRRPTLTVHLAFSE